MAVTEKHALKPLAILSKQWVQERLNRQPARQISKNSSSPDTPQPRSNNAMLQAFCLSALALPGMLSHAYADEAPDVHAPPSAAPDINTGEGEDEAGYQYDHYEEGSRQIFTGTGSNTITSSTNSKHQRTTTTTSTGNISEIPSIRQPITVDSEHGFGKFKITDRVRFSFNFDQDVWSGATPLWTGFAVQGFNGSSNLNGATIGASPHQSQGGPPLFFNPQGQAFYPSLIKTATTGGVTQNTALVMTPTSQLQHTMGYASPEMRNQAGFKLGYDFDHAAVDAGGGLSVERDYHTDFVNLGGRMDFNQKRTTVNAGLSYTNSQTHAQLINYVDYGDYSAAQFNTGNAHGFINGNREDSAFSLGISQVMNKNGVFSAGFNYMRSSGYMANPYKSVLMMQLDPNYTSTLLSNAGLTTNPYPNLTAVSTGIVAERRPTLRNQFTWDGNYLHYIEPLNAAAKVGYSFFHDDWGINAHTFEGEWRQALGSSWLLTPSARYYSQSAASFYAPYFFTTVDVSGLLNSNIITPLSSQSFSSDQRLSAYGSLSYGFTLTKQLTPAISMDVGLQYYQHASSLKLGGGGSGDFTDFHYYMASAGFKANTSKLAQASNLFNNVDGDALDWVKNLFEDPSENEHSHHQHMAHQHNHGSAPAGVMFADMMEEGQYMIGYRLMRSTQSGNMMNGTQVIDPNTASANKVGCFSLINGKSAGCSMYSNTMTMNMHMLDIMYAPTSWLTLMLMPQFMNMDMDMTMESMGAGAMSGMNPTANYRNWQANGGLGDTGAYALFKLWDDGIHHLHVTHGVTAPTGSIKVRGEFESGNTALYPMDMQNGSGTWDYKPSLTYSGHVDDWFWGGQLAGTKRLQKSNYLGYALGDIIQGSAWGGYKFNNWVSGTVRGILTGQGQARQAGNYINNPGSGTPGYGYVSGAYSSMMSMPDSFIQNYGGTFGDIGFGLTLSVPKGRLAGNSLSFEWLQPMYTDFNGYQVERTGTLYANWNYGF